MHKGTLVSFDNRMHTHTGLKNKGSAEIAGLMFMVVVHQYSLSNEDTLCRLGFTYNTEPARNRAYTVTI